MVVLRLVLLSCVCLLPLTASAEETREVEISGMKLVVPTSWKQKQPSNKLRLAEFEIPAAEGDTEAGELTLSGPFGGSVAQNVERWVAQFAPEGRESKITTGTGTQGKYVFVDLKGSYKKPVGPPVLGKTQAVAGYRMLAIMYTVDGAQGGNYFLKLTAPEKTAEASAAALRASVGGDAAKEEAFAN
jgi:gluconolactonase